MARVISCLLFLCLIRQSLSLSESADDYNLFSDEKEYDEDETEAVGSVFTHIFADSQSQLILDMDIFKYFFDYPEGYKDQLFEGNVDFAKHLIEYVNTLRKYDISGGCLADLFHISWTAVEYATHVKEHKNCTDCKCTPLFLQKKNERSWIFNVIDSMGKIPAGILAGNNLWVGSYDTCSQIKVVKNQQNQIWQGQYCLVHMNAYYRDNPLKFAVASSGKPDDHCFATDEPTTELPDLEPNRCFDLIPILNFGLCVPNTCTEYDVTKLIKFASRIAETASGRDSVCNVTVECRSGERERELAESQLSHFARSLLLFIGIVVFFGTTYDYFILRPKIKHLSSAEQKKAKNNEHGLLKFLTSFSAYTNGKQILRTDTIGKQDQIDCLHGIRFLSMAWIILGHTYYYIGTSLTMDNLIPMLVSFPKMFLNQIILQAPLAVDSFFYLSGLLSSYMTFKKLHKDKIIKSLKNPLLWIMIYVRRYLRITPTYVFIMLLDVTIFSYFTNGPFWRPIEKTGCKISWWTNLIYMNNFLLQDKECCMGWTWYLANDFQLQVFSPLLLIPLSTNPKVGFGIAGSIIALSSVLQAVVGFINDYPPAPLLTAKLQIVEKLESYWNDVYVKPYIRCQPFIIGILVGYLLVHFTKNKPSLRFKLRTKDLLIGWTVSSILGAYSVFGLYYFSLTGDISQIWSIMYAAFGRLSYALAIGWVSFACTTGNTPLINNFLGWKFFTPLSRITFGAYLIHPILLQVYNLSRPQPFHMTSSLQMLRHACEAIFISYAVSFLISLCFEIPVSIFEEKLMSKLNSSVRRAQSRNVSNKPPQDIELVDKEKLRQLKPAENGNKEEENTESTPCLPDQAASDAKKPESAETEKETS